MPTAKGQESTSTLFSSKKHEALAKKFILKTIASLKKQKAQVKKGSFGVPKPWSHQITAINALVKSRRYSKDEERLPFELSERDDRVKSVVTGFLVIHVLEILKVFVTSKSYLPGVPLCLYLVAKMGNNLRNSTVYSASNLGRIRIDCAFHLPIEISEWRDSRSNTLRLEVWGFQDPEAHYFIGKIKEHVYQFIKDTHGILRRPLSAEDAVAGEMIYEFAFSYGCFGYGHSNQITNPDCPLMESVNHCMFPRIRPSNDDNVTNKLSIRTPKRLHMMSVSSFIQDMPPQGIVTRQGKRIEPAQLKEPKKIVIQKVDYEDGSPLHCYLNLKIWQSPIQADLNDSYGDFLCLTHRKDRLKFVEEMSFGRKMDFREMEAGAVFESMDDAVVEKIIKSERHTGTLVYPDKFPCPEQQPIKLTKEEEKFMDLFPAVVRTTGYLGAMFGFVPKPQPIINNDMDFPAYRDAGKFKLRGFFGCRVFFFTVRDICRHMFRCIISCCTFLFPDAIVKLEEDPQVSLRMPSPEGSTVNLYSYFIQQEEEPPVLNPTIQEIAKNSAALTDLQNEEAPNYGDIMGMDAIQSEMTTASVKQSMVDAHVLV